VPVEDGANDRTKYRRRWRPKPAGNGHPIVAAALGATSRACLRSNFLPHHIGVTIRCCFNRERSALPNLPMRRVFRSAAAMPADRSDPRGE
jgi:hypothetical protein